MTIAVTGATGNLGRLVVAALIEILPREEIVAVARNAEKAESLGVPVRMAGYHDVDALTAAFADVDTLLFISGSEVGQRIPQHSNVITAASRAGVGRVVYTSAPRADDTTLILAPDHAATERLLAESGLTTTVLRNNWYTENYTDVVATAKATGVVSSAAGDGRVASASYADFAAGAVAALTTEGHEGKVYELGGDTAWTFADFAATLSEVLGRPISYQALTPAELDAQLAQAGLDEATRSFLVGLDVNIAEGTLAEVTGDLSRLLGRPTTPLVDTLRTLA